MKKNDTFSANSLKSLEKDLIEFENKYIYNLNLFKKDKRAKLGEKFHSLICAFLKGFDISKMLLELNESEFEIWQKLKERIEPEKNNFIKTEYSFLIKEKLEEKFYFLTGRFDAIYKKNENYIIYDWKTLNLPKEPQNDLQTIVYLYCASVIFNSKNIKMRYFSIEKLNFIDIDFSSKEFYKKKIDNIILKAKKYL